MSGQDLSVTIIDEDVRNSSFASIKAPRSLRVTCYGSSSALTPEPYLIAARSLGYLLAKRGHVCINGAGQYGCMAAMNDGAVVGNGHIIGVIHELFLVDSGDGGGKRVVDRDGGAHSAFANVGNDDNGSGPIREILVAGGDDLQERKKLLVKNAEALVVLPGGPGTWDELWEMACMRHLSLLKLPIVCINVDGYYEPFKVMLDRAYKDKLIKLKPEHIVHFAPTPEEAICWIEAECDRKDDEASTYQHPAVRRKLKNESKRGSFFATAASSITENSEGISNEGDSRLWNVSSTVLGSFGAGLALGAGISCAFFLNRRK